MFSWAPFAEGTNGIFQNPVLEAIAEKHGKTVGQVILRVLIREDVIVIPKTVRRERMEENIDVFDFALDPEGMERFAQLNEDSIPRIFDHHDPKAAEWLLGDLVRKQQLEGKPLY